MKWNESENIALTERAQIDSQENKASADSTTLMVYHQGRELLEKPKSVCAAWVISIICAIKWFL
jgi:hypothetical protein